MGSGVDEEAVEPLNSDVEPLRSDVEPLRSDVEPLNSDVEPLNSEVEPLNSDVEPLNSEVEPLRSEVAPLGSEVAPLNSDVEPLNSEVEPLNSEVEPLNSKVNSLTNDKMKICIVGAGAIGGYLGAKLALAGEAVTLIARGSHLEAIQKNGLKLIMADGSSQVVNPSLATSNIQEAGTQDVVILTVKAHSVSAIAPALSALYDSHTMVVTAQNGVPWWYFRQHGGEYEGTRIQSVDPDGIIEANIGVDRVIGCVVYPATEIVEPGVIKHLEGDRLTLGEIDGTKSDRIQSLAQTLKKAGFKAPIRNQIRTEIWIKLWGNVAFNPISALTGATLESICQYPLTRELARQMMTEAQAIAQNLGIKFGITLEQRINGAENVGAHKTSMLQDIEAGRPTEIDAIVGAVAELGKLTQIPTPCIDAIYASVKLLEANKVTSLPIQNSHK